MNAAAKKTKISPKLDFNAMSLPQIIAAVANDNTLQDPRIRREFNRAAQPHSQPSRLFEAEVGIDGIAGAYSFPAGVDVPQLEEMLVLLPSEGDTLPILQEIWRRLEALNPALAGAVADKDDAQELYFTLVGTTSDFNIDDINYFVELRRQGLPPAAYSLKQPEYRAPHEAIQARTGVYIQWVPAPATMEKIKVKLDAKEKSSTAAPKLSGR